ncbi:MAG: hypothetical protein KDB40_08490 [Acidimicrobiales bacterium]|nr:hypothetical protein [Acidimicrobiales bacterium]
MRRRLVSPARAERRDEGSAFVLALVTILVASLVVLPVMDYTMSVLRTDSVRSDFTERTEAVKGGLRAALFDPVLLYQACVDSGRTTSVELAVPPGLGIRSYCTTTKDALQDVPSEQRFAIATTQVGSEAMIPPNYVAEPERPELDGTVGTDWCTSMVNADVNAKIPCGKPYPGNGNTDTTAWQADTSSTSEGAVVFAPALPPFQNYLAYAGGYMMPPGDTGPCRVYFPGKYTDDVVIADSTPTYFVSGIYYFEKALRISGNAQVVAGTGKMPGCVESDAVAVADAINAPFDATSNGVGATFVFGANGRLVIDTVASGSAMSFVMNRRLVAEEDPLRVLNDVSIMSVNGVFNGSATAPLDLPAQLNVPVTPVLNGSVYSPDPWTHFYRASNLVSTPSLPVACALPLSGVTADCPIIDIQLTNASTVTLKIPGYVSVPQGSVLVTGGTGSSANKTISFGGGILAAQMAVDGEPPAFLQLGLLNPVVQKTFKIVTETVSGSPSVRSIALVQVNESGGHAVNSWVIETTASG